MATRYSDIGTIQNAPTASTLLLGRRIEAVPCAPPPILVTVVSGEAATDVVRLVKLPKGTIILPYESYIYSEGGNAGGGGSGVTWTVDIGDDDDTVAADPDRYCDGANVAAAGFDLFTAPTVTASTYTPYALGKESWITLTHATFTSVTVGRRLWVYLRYLPAV